MSVDTRIPLNYGSQCSDCRIHIFIIRIKQILLSFGTLNYALFLQQEAATQKAISEAQRAVFCYNLF